jgi:hypothetical protein
MLADIETFKRAVELKQTGVFLEVGEVPDWMVKALLEIGSDHLHPKLRLLISSDTAEAKLRKHPELGDMTSLLQLISDCVLSDLVEVRVSKYPNSIETYLIAKAKIWLVAFKRTAINEIVVSTAYSTNLRNLRKSRKRILIFGSELNEKDVDGRP